MPRIPQGQFDITPSTRVGVNQAQMPVDGMDGVVKGMAKLTGAMAMLQDQGERTEAYNAANDVKQNYLRQKVTYMEALNTVDENGIANYFDPTDSNPDLTKRKKITRPIFEMQKEMMDSYAEAKKTTGGLQRADIAHELMRNYVGDDLIGLEMDTNKRLNTVRTKKVDKTVGENMELHLSSAMNELSDPDTTPEMVSSILGRMNNNIAREFATAAPILGTEAMKEKQQHLDRAFGTVANNLISTGGVTNRTVASAEGFISRIKDPLIQQMEMNRLEKTKKYTAETKFITSINTAADMTQSVLAAKSLKDEDYLKGVQAVKSLNDTYTDEKYVRGGDEKKKAAMTELLSALIAKRTIQQKLGEDLTFLNNPAKDKAEGLPAEGNWNEVYRKKQAGITSSDGIKASEGLFDFIKGKEDFSATAYGDQGDGKGVQTNGYGNTHGDLSKPVTRTEAEKMMRDHVAAGERELSAVITRKDLTQSQMNVLLDMHYNMGINNMQSFIKVVNEGTPAQIEASLSGYTKAEAKGTDGKPILGPDGEPQLIEMGGLVKRTAARLEMWRNPAGGDVAAELLGPKHKELATHIDQELEASGINKLIEGSGIADSVREMAVKKMATMHSSLKEDVADIVATTKPHLQGRAKMEEIARIYDIQQLGDPVLVSKKEQAAFKTTFQDALAKSPNDALDVLNTQLDQAGEAWEGEASYRRAMAQDLAGKNDDMAFIMPLADADPIKQREIISGAGQYKELLERTDIAPKNFQENFEINAHLMKGLESIRKNNPSMYKGIKQAVIYSACNNIKDIGDVNNAMKKAMEDMGDLYSGAEMDGSAVLAVNRSGKKFDSRQMQEGMGRATALPMLDYAQKYELLKTYNPSVVGKKPNGDWNPPPAPDKMDWYIQRLVKIEPDARYPNMHEVKINGARVTDPSNKVLKVSSDDIYQYGKNAELTMSEDQKLRLEVLRRFTPGYNGN